MSRRLTLTVVCCAILLVPIAPARAAAPASAPVPQMFPRGSFTLTSDVAYTRTFDDEANIAALQLGVNYFVFDNISVGAELTGYGVFMDDDGDDTTAAAIQLGLVARHHFLRWDRFSLFADGSFGPFEASDDVPASGTRFNYVTRAGLGLTYQLDDRVYLFGGARYFHLSNARLEGIEHNPQMNGV